MTRNPGLHVGNVCKAAVAALSAGTVLAALTGAGIVADACLFQQPALAKKFKSKDKNTLDPAINNYEEGVKRVKAGDIDGAIDSLLQAIYFARNQYHPAAYFMLGNCYKLKGEDAKALEALKKHVLQNVGPSPDAHCDIAEILMRNGRDREAEAELNRALAEFRGPGPRAHNMMGKLLEKKGDLKNAAWHFEQALGDQPWWYTDAWMNLAENMMKQREWSAALQQYFGILARGNTLKGVDYQKVHLNIGTCMLNKGDHHGAIDNWHKVLELNPDHPQAHLYLGLLLDKEQHISSAIKEYRAFLRVAPTDGKAQLVKDRLSELEQKIAPSEPEPVAAKPSPYMRQQMEQEAASKRAMEEEMRRRMENLESLGPSTPQKGDSGF